MGGKSGTIINQIRKLRQMKTDLTQAEFARQVGVTRQTIIAIEAGRYGPSLELAFRIAHILDEPIDKVFIFDPRW